MINVCCRRDYQQYAVFIFVVKWVATRGGHGSEIQKPELFSSVGIKMKLPGIH